MRRLLFGRWLTAFVTAAVILVPLPVLADEDFLDAESPSSTPPSPPIQDYNLRILARAVRTVTRLPGESNYDLSQRALNVARNACNGLMSEGTAQQKSLVETLPRVTLVTYNGFTPDASSPTESVSIVGNDATATVQKWGVNHFTAYVNS